jgi:ankyrin repeat protein
VLYSCPRAQQEIDGVNSAAVIDAVKEGDAARLRELVAAEPGSASARDGEGMSALLHAVYRNRADLVEILLAARPTIDVFEAAAIGDEARLRKLLEREPELVSAWSRDGFTPLHLAAFFGHEAAARLLLGLGADPSIVSHSPLGVAPLHSAAAGDHAHVARLLVEAGADVNARQRGGWVPLHSAAANGDAELVRFLLERGADPDARQDEGKSAADVANDKGHEEVVELLSAANP